MDKNIIIIGITGVGKTTVGRLIADKLNKEFIDLDRSIEAHCGVDIPTIFAIEGEDGFRRRETDELNRIIYSNMDYVLSVGGGCVVKPENRNIILSGNNIIVQLVADVKVLVERLLKSPPKRPMFQNTNIEAKIIELYNARKEIYDSVTDVKLNTSMLKQSQVADLVVNYIINK